jgi:hypothetical protein
MPRSSSFAPLLGRPRRHSRRYATRTSTEPTLRDQRATVRPQRSAQPPHRPRSLRPFDLPQLTHRIRRAQIPIAPAAPPRVPPARFPPLEAFGRRPSACAAPPFIGPASETLHTSGHRQILDADCIFGHINRSRAGGPSRRRPGELHQPTGGDWFGIGVESGPERMQSQVPKVVGQQKP